ncbi:hypothetical protein [Actinoplanes regularis]|uniref:CdiA C-terminal domain-containing protein n=1 Tax=Actinoplanes regularis TaxID=52697 RepID=UPI0024A273AA|nr:hypothetical protein [Actinoplanes regularis]GLW34647.1 hypothetical protein Areg01_75840 [Actinoplanes regularis]
MAHSKGHDRGDSPAGRRRGPGSARSIGATHNTAAQTATRGRTKNKHPSSWPAPPSGDPTVTRPTGRKGGDPDGSRTLIDLEQGDEAKRSLDRENSVATHLAAAGYLIKQNPSKAEVAEARDNHEDHGAPNSDPDYLLEGRVFDCYSPNPETNPRNVWSYVLSKVKREQTQRVIVDLKDWSGDISAMVQQFADWPITNLKEVKFVTPADEIVQVIPYPSID